MINFGNTIRTHRKKRGLTQVALAKKIGMESTYLSAIENGRREPSLTLVKQISRAVTTPPEVLFWEAVQITDAVSARDRRAVDAAKQILRHYLKSE